MGARDGTVITCEFENPVVQTALIDCWIEVRGLHGSEVRSGEIVHGKVVGGSDGSVDYSLARSRGKIMVAGSMTCLPAVEVLSFDLSLCLLIGGDRSSFAGVDVNRDWYVMVESIGGDVVGIGVDCGLVLKGLLLE